MPTAGVRCGHGLLTVVYYLWSCILHGTSQLKRRQLYKDSESLRKGELHKMRQDFFLDRLHGQLQEMLEQKDLIMAQIKALEADVQISRTAIQEAQSRLARRRRRAF